MKNRNYYEDYEDEMILRDVLAKDRTHLANERTLLSFIRAFLNFFIGGISLIKLFNDLTIQILGVLVTIGSFYILLLGIKKYLRIKSCLDHLK